MQRLDSDVCLGTEMQIYVRHKHNFQVDIIMYLQGAQRTTKVHATMQAHPPVRYIGWE